MAKTYMYYLCLLFHPVKSFQDWKGCELQEKLNADKSVMCGFRLHSSCSNPACSIGDLHAAEMPQSEPSAGVGLSASQQLPEDFVYQTAWLADSAWTSKGQKDDGMSARQRLITADGEHSKGQPLENLLEVLGAGKTLSFAGSKSLSNEAAQVMR